MRPAPLAVTCRVEVYTKQSCSYCIEAKRLLEKNAVPFMEWYLDDPVVFNKFRQKYPKLKTAPQIFVEGQHIGGFKELKQYHDDVVGYGAEDVHKLFSA